MNKKYKRFKRKKFNSYLYVIFMLVSFIIIVPLTFTLLSISERKVKEEDSNVIKVYDDFKCLSSKVDIEENSDELTILGGEIITNADVEKFYITINDNKVLDLVLESNIVKYRDDSLCYSFNVPYLYDVNNLRFYEEEKIDVKLYAEYESKDYMVYWNIVSINGSLETYDFSRFSLSRCERVYPNMGSNYSSESGWTIIDNRIDQVRRVNGNTHEILVANIDYFEIEIDSIKYYLVKGDRLYFRNAFNISNSSYYILTLEDIHFIKDILN